ncbi:protein phosphatase 2A structural subunit [Savitreella phatthalungensis]
MSGQQDTLYPIAILIDELKHEDVQLRLNAIRRLATIALALGPQRTRDELIPFLDESLDDEDEVLQALAAELGQFVDYVGGPEHAHVLLTPLAHLAAVEETLVREKAVESLNAICEILSQDQVEQHYVALIERLATGDWFTSRSSSAGLFAAGYEKAGSSSRERLRTLFIQLCHDETPMVRRAAAANLAKLIPKLEGDIVFDEAVPELRLLSTDDQDSVRLLTVEALIAVTRRAGESSATASAEQVLRIFNALTNDKSWRVRYMVADHLVSLAEAANQQTVDTELVPAFIQLLRDSEAEVRTAVASQIAGICKLVPKERILDPILLVVKDLITDSSQYVRAAWGKQISALAPILGKQDTIDNLLPMFLQMLKDEYPDVRLNIISKLEQVNNVIGIELLSQSLLPAIVKLAEDKQWRVRLAIIEYIPLLAGQLGVEFFDEQLADLCMSWLGDSVFSIREAATVNLRKLIEVFDIQWAQQSIIPKVLAMGQHSNYLYRMTTIFAITTLAPVVNVTVIKDMILPVLDTLADDRIPNIRFNVAKSYGAISPVLREHHEGHSVLDDVRQSLERLGNDSDPDVVYFAQRALAV